MPSYLRGLGERISDEVHECAEAVSLMATAMHCLEDRPPPLDAGQAESMADLRQGLDRVHSALHRLQVLVR